MDKTNKKILIIDDNPSTVETLKMILETEGYETAGAYNGEVGVKKAISLHPDLIMLDLMLPDIDGYKVCEKIKNNPEIKDIPVVILTGKDKGDDFDRAMEKDADWYIVKPYKVEHLLKVFRRLIEKDE
ncbi:MAG: response regulator [Elusimicrobiota bacterium]